MSVHSTLIENATAEMRAINESLASAYNVIEQEFSIEDDRVMARKRASEAARALGQKVYENLSRDTKTVKRGLEQKTFGVSDNARYFEKVAELATVSGSELSDTYERATRYGDKSTMAAAASRAIETGNESIITQHAEQDAAFRNTYQEYQAFSRATNRPGYGLMASMRIGAVRQPYAAEKIEYQAGHVIDGRGVRRPVMASKTTWSTEPIDGKPATGINTLGMPQYRLAATSQGAD